MSKPTARLLGMMRIKNEERWLPRALASLSEIVDGIVILDDGSTDRTPEICRSCQKVVRYEYQREPVVDEVRDKNRLLAWTLELEPDWVVALDGDDAFEDRAKHVIREEIGRIDGHAPQFSHFYVNYVYFWDREDQYVDQEAWIARVFTLWGQDERALRFEPHPEHEAGFHCGSIPRTLRGRGKKIDVMLKHFGYLHEADRRRKYRFYATHDPEQAARGYYDHLVDLQPRLFTWVERSPQDPVRRFDREEPPVRPWPAWYTGLKRVLPARCVRLLRRIKSRRSR